MTQSQQAAQSPSTLFGGDWSLDFANSGEEWEDGYPQLLDWSQRVGLAPDDQARAMRRRAEQTPEAAQATFARARTLQAALHAIFWALAHGEAAAPRDLATLNQQLAQVMGKLRIEPDGQEGAVYHWGWERRDDALDRMLWPVTRAAAELLQSPNLVWLKACANDECDQLFLDLSRNHSRRWCEMRHCGMLAKSHRYYAKQRQTRGYPSRS